MAEYCSQCSPFKGRYDIDLFAIAIRLKRGYSTGFICEGCSNRAVYKDEAGLIYLVKLENDLYQYVLVNLEDLMQ